MIAKTITAAEIPACFAMRHSTMGYHLLNLALQQAAALTPPYPTFQAFCQTLAGPAQKPTAQSIQRTLARAVDSLWEQKENHALLDKLYGYHVSEKPSAKDFVYTVGSYIHSASAQKQPREKNTLQGVYQQYVRWAHTESPLTLPDFLRCTAASEDVFEDEHCFVARLFYLVPDSSKESVRCFVFYEENTFIKDDMGELQMVKSRYYTDIQKP